MRFNPDNCHGEAIDDDPVQYNMGHISVSLSEQSRSISLSLISPSNTRQIPEERQIFTYNGQTRHPSKRANRHCTEGKSSYHRTQWCMTEQSTTNQLRIFSTYFLPHLVRSPSSTNNQNRQCTWIIQNRRFQRKAVGPINPFPKSIYHRVHVVS